MKKKNGTSLWCPHIERIWSFLRVAITKRLRSIDQLPALKNLNTHLKQTKKRNENKEAKRKTRVRANGKIKEKENEH